MGLYRAAIVSSVDAERLNGHDGVRFLRAGAGLASHHEAGKLRVMSEVVFSRPGDADSPVERGFEEIEYAAVEVAAALRLTRRAAEAEVNRAVSLSGRLHRVLDAFSNGEIDLARVRVFDEMLSHLSEIVDAVFGSGVVGGFRVDGWSVARSPGSTGIGDRP